MAANSGVSDRVFQKHGRWKSVQAKDIYVDDDLDQRLSLSKRRSSPGALQINLFVSAVLCYLLWSKGKICYF